MNKEKQIEEMAKVMHERVHEIAVDPYGMAKLEAQSKTMPDDFADTLYNAGYRKSSECEKEIADWKAIAEQYRKQFEDCYEEKTKITSEIFEEIEKQLARYSHLHRYAEEAKTATEEYADGTPCEMTSVWEVIPLHKNGWDDYETMNKLQDNIEDIAKSRLLKEIEGDIAELKKKYTEEGK